MITTLLKWLMLKAFIVYNNKISNATKIAIIFVFLFLLLKSIFSFLISTLNVT